MPQSWSSRERRRSSGWSSIAVTPRTTSTNIAKAWTTSRSTVASKEALEEWAERLSNVGVAYSGPTEIPRGGILNFRDPDNIALALFWDQQV